MWLKPKDESLSIAQICTTQSIEMEYHAQMQTLRITLVFYFCSGRLDRNPETKPKMAEITARAQYTMVV